MTFAWLDSNMPFNTAVATSTLMYCEDASVADVAVAPNCYGAIPLPLADATLGDLTNYPCPNLTLSRDTIVLPRHILVDMPSKGIHPYTFMRNRRNHHGGIRYHDDGTYKIKYDATSLPKKIIEGPCYHADTDHPSVYGHVLLEVVSALWATKHIPGNDLRLLTSIKLNEGYLAFFNALDLPTQRIEHIAGPIITKELWLPSKLIQRRRYIDPKVRALYSEIAERLSENSKISAPEKVYISRSKVSGRKLINEVEVEALFRDLGFAIIHPQELSIFDQVKIFSHAKCIAGTGGSAMHNTLFSKVDSQVLIICSTGWRVVADTLICTRQGQLGYVFGKPHTSNAGSHRTQSDWSVDLREVAAGARLHFDI